MARPVAIAARIAVGRDHPWYTSSTARIDPDAPLTDPIERSISPSSSTSTTPMEIIPIVAESRLSSTRLRDERKREFWV